MKRRLQTNDRLEEIIGDEENNIANEKNIAKDRKVIPVTEKSFLAAMKIAGLIRDFYRPDPQSEAVSRSWHKIR